MTWLFAKAILYSFFSLMIGTIICKIPKCRIVHRAVCDWLKPFRYTVTSFHLFENNHNSTKHNHSQRWPIDCHSWIANRISYRNVPNEKRYSFSRNCTFKHKIEGNGNKNLNNLTFPFMWPPRLIFRRWHDAVFTTIICDLNVNQKTILNFHVDCSLARCMCDRFLWNTFHLLLLTMDTSFL